MIEQLPVIAPDTDRRVRTLDRCHDKLDRRRVDARATGRWAIERNALLGFGVIYMSSVAFAVLQVLIK